MSGKRQNDSRCFKLIILFKNVSASTATVSVTVNHNVIIIIIFFFLETFWQYAAHLQCPAHCICSPDQPSSLATGSSAYWRLLVHCKSSNCNCMWHTMSLAMFALCTSFSAKSFDRWYISVGAIEPKLQNCDACIWYRYAKQTVKQVKLSYEPTLASHFCKSLFCNGLEKSRLIYWTLVNGKTIKVTLCIDWVYVYCHLKSGNSLWHS